MVFLNHYFVIGPYDHWGGQRKASPNLMGYEIDSVANISMEKLAYDWLDFILKGKPKPELLKDKVNYQVMGTNEWKHSPSFQKINNDTLTLYLTRTLPHAYTRSLSRSLLATISLQISRRDIRQLHVQPFKA